MAENPGTDIAPKSDASHRSPSISSKMNLGYKMPCSVTKNVGVFQNVFKLALGDALVIALETGSHDVCLSLLTKISFNSNPPQTGSQSYTI